MADCTRRPIEHLAVLVKPTMACNASCPYCSPGCGVRTTSKPMTREVLRRSLEALRDFCLERGKELLTLIWHGGEPTLMPPAFYEEVRRLERNLIESEGIAVVNGLQTNLTTGVERIRTIAEILGVRQIGTSYDPDGLRTLPAADFQRTWLSSFIRLRRSFPVGVIYVINRRTREREAALLAHFSNLGFRAVKLNWMYHSVHHDRADPSVLSAAEVGESLCAFLRLQSRFPLVLQGLPELDGHRLNCTFEGSRTCTENFLGISSEGGVYNCGRLMDVGIGHGNLSEGGIAELLERSPVRRLLKARDDMLLGGDCAGCARWELCHGGCAVDGYLHAGSVQARSGLCEAFLKLMEMMRHERGATAS